MPAGQSAKNRRNNVYAPRRISTYVRLAEKMVEKLKEISVVFFSLFCVRFNYNLRKLSCRLRITFFLPNLNFLHFFERLIFQIKLAFGEIS